MWNLTAGAARPNPQSSYHYGQINVTQTLLLRGSKATINGVTRYAFTDVSYQAPNTPLKLVDYYNLTGIFRLDAFPEKPLNRSASFLSSVISGGYKGVLEIIFQNDGHEVQSYHLDGFAFLVVGGTWTESYRGNVNKWDGVARSTTQGFHDLNNYITLVEKQGTFLELVDFFDGLLMGHQVEVEREHCYAVREKAGNLLLSRMPKVNSHMTILEPKDDRDRHSDTWASSKWSDQMAGHFVKVDLEAKSISVVPCYHEPSSKLGANDSDFCGLHNII